MSVSSVKNLNGETFSAVQDTSLTEFVQTNSASWGQGGGTTYTGDAQGALDEVYANSGVWLTAHQDISNLLPKSESANYYPMTGNPSGFLTAHQSLSNYVSKSDTSVAVGLQNSASYSFAQGERCSATYYSFAQGYSNSAYSTSLAQGITNSAYNASLAQGTDNTAYNASIAQGGDNYAANKSQAFGNGTKATNSGMAIGTYNKTYSAAFVVGNGNFKYRSDSFIIYHDGSVSAAGKISANGVELGAGGGAGNPEVESYVQTNSANIDDTVTSYQTNSGTFLTAHQAISAEEWNSNYETVNTNSGVWGGSALPISAGPGIDVQLENNKLVFSAIPNETVIYTGVYDTTTTSIVCDEPLTSFENVKVLWQHQNKTCDWSEYPTTLNQWYKNLGRSDNGASLVSFFTIWETNNNEAHFYNSWYFHVPTGTMTWTFGATGLNEVKPIKVVGINRIGG